MELLTYLSLGLIIDVSTCMNNITTKIRLQYGSYQHKLTHMYDSSSFGDKRLRVKSSLIDAASMKHYTT